MWEQLTDAEKQACCDALQKQIDSLAQFMRWYTVAAAGLLVVLVVKLALAFT